MVFLHLFLRGTLLCPIQKNCIDFPQIRRPKHWTMILFCRLFCVHCRYPLVATRFYHFIYRGFQFALVFLILCNSGNRVYRLVKIKSDVGLRHQVLWYSRRFTSLVSSHFYVSQHTSLVIVIFQKSKAHRVYSYFIAWKKSIYLSRNISIIGIKWD